MSFIEGQWPCLQILQEHHTPSVHGGHRVTMEWLEHPGHEAVALAEMRVERDLERYLSRLSTRRVQSNDVAPERSLDMPIRVDDAARKERALGLFFEAERQVGPPKELCIYFAHDGGLHQSATKDFSGSAFWRGGGTLHQ